MITTGRNVVNTGNKSTCVESVAVPPSAYTGNENTRVKNVAVPPSANTGNKKAYVSSVVGHNYVKVHSVKLS